MSNGTADSDDRATPRRFSARILDSLRRGRSQFATINRDWIRRNRQGLILASLLFLFLVAALWPRIFIRVRSGEAGVLYSLLGGGTVVDYVYPEGLHMILPWDVLYVYNVRIQEREQDLQLLTRNGLHVSFKLSIRYQPEYETVGLLHQKVGPDYVEKIVVPQVVSVLRTQVGQFSAEEVYTTRRAILERIFFEAIQQVARRYIAIDQVLIRSIELPATVQEAIEDKIKQRHLAESYEYRIQKEQREARRKEIEAEGYRLYNEVVATSLTDDVLKWKGIEATRELATSPNAKVVVVGNGDGDLPIILGGPK